MQTPAVTSSFWEYGDAIIDTVREAHRVMERTMTRGSWRAMCWLRQTYSEQQIKTFLASKGVNVRLPRELNYWLLITDTASEERKTLVATAQKKQSSGRGHAH